MCFGLGTLPGPAGAQGDIALQWTGCGAFGTRNVNPFCSANVGEERMVFTIAPQTSVTQVVGWALVMDLASDVDPLPSWWQIQAGGCRQGQLVAVPPNGAEGDCLDVWSATGAGVVQTVIAPGPSGDTRTLRAIVGVSVPSTSAFTLAAGQTYLAAVVAVHLAYSTGFTVCAGCATPVCMVFNSADIARLPGAPGPGPQAFVTPAVGIGNQVTWRGGTSCDLVPVRSTTWGRIKALYR